jgi:hypothetical protein
MAGSDATHAYWRDWVRHQIGGNEIVQAAALGAALDQIRQGNDGAAAAAAAQRVAESMGVVPKGKAPGALACRLCGSTPAVNVRIREHNGRIIFMVSKTRRGPFCRSCGLALFRQMQNSTLYQGWFGMVSFFITPIILFLNVLAWLRLQALPHPSRNPNVQSAIPAPLDPGKPLFQRAGPYIAGVLLGVLGLLFLKPGSSPAPGAPVSTTPGYASTSAPAQSATPTALTTVPPLPTSGNAFSFTSQPGDFIGQGKTEILTAPAWSFTAGQSNLSSGDIRIELRSGNGINMTDWTIELAAPGDAPLAVGTYSDAMRAAVRNNGLPGLDISGHGNGCNQVFGQFTVTKVTYGATGQLQELEATFIQHCESVTAPPLAGAIRWTGHS